MDKNEIILEIANDILNRLNIGQIVNVLRDHSLNQANVYYDSLSEEDKNKLEEQILENRKKAEEAQNQQEKTESTEREEEVEEEVEEKSEDLEVVS